MWDLSWGGKGLDVTYQQWLERGLIACSSCIISLSAGWFTVVRGAATGADIEKVTARVDRLQDYAYEQQVFNQKVLGRIEAKEILWQSKIDGLRMSQDALPALVAEKILREMRDTRDRGVRDASTP